MPVFASLIIDWILTALWPIVGQAGLRFYSPVLLTETGFAIGLLCLLPSLWSKGRWKTLFSRSLFWPLLWIGLFNGIASFLYIVALNYTTPSDAGIVAEFEVLYSLALSFLILREKISIKQIAASLAVMVGTILILTHDLDSQRWKGDLIILLTPWMFQVSHILVKRLPRDLDLGFITAARLFYETLALLPFALWAVWTKSLWTWSAHGMELLLLQGIGMCFLMNFLWYMTIRRMDLAKATAFLLSYPALTMLFAWALGQERISPIQIIGLMTTLAGAAWLSFLILAGPKQKNLKDLPPTQKPELIF